MNPLFDLTDERAASLDYDACYALVHYGNHLRREEGQETVEFDFAKAAEILAVLFPGAAFTPPAREDGARPRQFPVAAEARAESASLLEALGAGFLSGGDFDGTVCRDRGVLRAAYQTEYSRVVFCQGGAGLIVEDDSSDLDFFAHDLDLEEVLRECGGDEDDLEQRLRDYFDENVNYELDDPYFDAAAADEPLDFSNGSREELDRLMGLFIMTEPGVEEQRGLYVRVLAGTEDENATLDANGGDDTYYSDRLDQLANLALNSNTPTGWVFEYNDGAYGRRSGYCMSPESISYDVEEILNLPARLRMAARRDLREWLAGLGEDPLRFLPAAEEVADAPEPRADDAHGRGDGDEDAPEDEEPLFPTIPFDPAGDAGGAEAATRT